tara:strand:- start:424 stop:690 length:267 start_codon:yes stop_codon:yes gene_type:complete
MKKNETILDQSLHHTLEECVACIDKKPSILYYPCLHVIGCHFCVKHCPIDHCWYCKTHVETAYDYEQVVAGVIKPVHLKWPLKNADDK